LVSKLKLKSTNNKRKISSKLTVIHQRKAKMTPRHLHQINQNLKRIKKTKRMTKKVIAMMIKRTVVMMRTKMMEIKISKMTKMEIPRKQSPMRRIRPSNQWIK